MRLCLSPLYARVLLIPPSYSPARLNIHTYIYISLYSRIHTHKHQQTQSFPWQKHTDTQIPAKCCGRWPALLSPSSNYPRRDPVSTTTAAMMPLPSVAFLFSLTGWQWDPKWSLEIPQVLEIWLMLRLWAQIVALFLDTSGATKQLLFFKEKEKVHFPFTKKYAENVPLHVCPFLCSYDQLCSQEIFSVATFLYHAVCLISTSTYRGFHNTLLARGIEVPTLTRRTQFILFWRNIKWNGPPH